jgi:hypothetical protein
MKRTIKTVMFFAAFVVMAVSVYEFASACQVDEFYHTKEGALAASTPEILNAAIKFEGEDSKVKLADLMKSGTVVRLAENVKVQVLERSFEFKALKITFPEARDPYWVTDGSLKQIDCK